MKNRWRIDPNWSNILPKSNKNGIKIYENSSLDVFRAKLRSGQLYGAPPSSGGLHFLSPFGRKWSSKGPFWTPAVIQNPLKTALLGLDRRRVPRKMSSGRRFGKTWEFNEKSMRKLMLFDRLEPRLALYSLLISHFRPFWKNRKIDAKSKLKVSAAHLMLRSPILGLLHISCR